MFKIQDGYWSNLVKWQTKLLKMKNFWIPSCLISLRSKLFIYTVFYLRKIKLTIPTKSWISHKLYETICVNCGFSTTPSQNFVKCKNGLYNKCRFWWVEQYWYSWLLHSRPSRVPKPMRGYEFFQHSKLSGSNFSKWKVDH